MEKIIAGKEEEEKRKLGKMDDMESDGKVGETWQE